ncbi:hypothetical protein G7046_g8756 [Stylonectria norvegica]|nr:hypothetical protein G7046_g8756 [Stylonectria norvegica]
MYIMSNDKDDSGSIVAFEGHTETISTQLRLLPTSPQILILPSIQCYFPNDDDAGGEFDARAYIKKVHDAVVARNQVAQTFIRESSSNNKRLVFLNGSTAAAQTLCIRSIMKHETDGDYHSADAIFRLLAKDGVAGLEDSTRNWKRRSTFEYFRGQDSEYALEDPITRAMRAADALDRQTASLQPTNDLDLTSTTRSRSNSLPLYGYADSFGDAAPFFVFGSRDREDTESVCEGYPAEDMYGMTSTNFDITQHGKPSEKVYRGSTNLQPPSPKPHTSRAPSCIGESYVSPTVQSPLCPELFTPRSDVFSIRSTDNVVYGEASLLDMRLSGRRASLTRVKSLDRIYPIAPKYRDLCLLPEPSEPNSLHHNQDALQDGRRHSSLAVSADREPTLSQLSYIQGPRTIVVKSHRPMVKLAPVPPQKKRKPARDSYVDRGTDADGASKEQSVFKPVLPFTEDLVVHFKGEVPDLILESVIRGFKSGHYPILSHSPTGSKVDDGNVPIQNTLESQSNNGLACQQSAFAKVSADSRSQERSKYDAFADFELKWPERKPILSSVPTVKVHRPPTPAQTPPPYIRHKGEATHEFSLNSQQTAVAIQNSLRSILKGYFPPENQGYRQFQFPLLTELEGLWRPIFREAEPGSPRKDNRRMDQIFAIGAQRGVKKDFASAITGQLEKLGNKASGMSRSGRLDFRYVNQSTAHYSEANLFGFRYLLANGMQAFTAQPLTNQAHDNPFTNCYLLATLIIPHLETYLALHSEVRFLLLEYPPEHLPTMLALQKLVGVDLMKVAQIVDCKSKESLPFTHLRGASIQNNLEQGSPTRFGSSLLSSNGLACDAVVSKANFLLTSSATDSEIATFISTVWKILIDISSFYAAEEGSKRPSPRKGKPSPLQGTFSPFPKVTSGPQSPPLSPPWGTRFGSGPPLTRAPSIAETFKTTKSTKSKRSRSRSKQKQPAMDEQSVLSVDLSDSDWDNEDRRILPILVKRPFVQKGNSKKALKFLGLA